MFGRVLNTFLTLFIFYFITLCMKGLTNPTPPTQQAFNCSRSTMLSKHSSWWRSVEDVVKTAWRSVQSNKFSSSKLPWRSLQKPLEDEQSYTSLWQKQATILWSHYNLVVFYIIVTPKNFLYIRITKIKKNKNNKKKISFEQNKQHKKCPRFTLTRFIPSQFYF